MENPLVHIFKRYILERNQVPSLQVHKDVPRCVPDLVRKLGAELESLAVDQDILSLSCEECQGELECIGAIFCNNVQRVDTVSERF